MSNEPGVDTIGGVVYEQMPEGEILLYLILIMITATILFVYLPAWRQTRQE